MLFVTTLFTRLLLQVDTLMRESENASGDLFVTTLMQAYTKAMFST